MSFRAFAPRVGLTGRQFLIILMAKYIKRNPMGGFVPSAGFERYFTTQCGELRLSADGVKFFIGRYNSNAIAYSWMRREFHD